MILHPTYATRTCNHSLTMARQIGHGGNPGVYRNSTRLSDTPPKRAGTPPERRNHVRSDAFRQRDRSRFHTSVVSQLVYLETFRHSSGSPGTGTFSHRPPQPLSQPGIAPRARSHVAPSSLGGRAEGLSVCTFTSRERQSAHESTVMTPLFLL